MDIIIDLKTMIKNNIIYSIIVFFLLISNIFIFFQNQKIGKNIIILNNKIIDLEKQNQELKSKPPLGWKEYTDGKYKFKVWYPEEIVDNIYGLTNVGVTESGDSVSGYSVNFFITAYDIPQPQMLHIYIYITNLDIKEAIKNDLRKDRRYRIGVDKRYSDAEIISGIQQNKFGGLDFYRFGDNGDYYLKKDDLLFAFIPGGSGPADYKQMYETMVQSFRFIE